MEDYSLPVQEGFRPLVENLVDFNHDSKVHNAEDNKRCAANADSLSTYIQPQAWPYPILPSPFIPYGELMRISKPVGIMNIYFPYLFGTMYASLVTPSLPPLLHIFRVNALLFLAGFLLRSLGCCWNDIIDSDLDRKVARCRFRPMARGAISPRNAYMFTFALTITWLYTLSQISRACVAYAIPLIFMVAFYPFAKRITDFAQVVLGVTLSWGVLIGCLAMGGDPISLILSPETRCSTGGGLVVLYLVYTLWTVTHDVIYAFQDLEDDVKAGIKGMAVRYRNHTEILLWSLATLQIALFFKLSQILSAGGAYFLFAIAGNAILHAAMIKQVNLGDPDACLWWFQTGCLIFGSTTFAGLFGEYLTRS